MSKQVLLFCFLFCSSVLLSAQYKVEGTVFDFSTKLPLEGVSVFYDGTSIGTITNQKGKFTLVSDKQISALLVISYIGYKTQMFSKPSNDLGLVYLIENAVQLDEVVMEPDTWSRERKLNIFRQEFLGTTIPALQCKIKNEKDIRLYYNKAKNTLFAYAEVPIQIQNNYLGYKIEYNLMDFEVNFGNFIGNDKKPGYTYTAGTLFFSELNTKKVKKKCLENRAKTYLGSTLHFMRALANKRLDEEKFQIFKDKFQIHPYTEFDIHVNGQLSEVNQKTKLLSILYDGREQSSIEVHVDTFYIDYYGNHSPSKDIFFGGVQGGQRVGNLLPLDYLINPID